MLLMNPTVDFDRVVANFWNDFQANFDAHDISIILVLDGKRNPAKFDTKMSVLRSVWTWTYCK